MPTYEYVCTKCGHEMEAFHSMKDVPHKLCPACKRRALRRKVGGGAGLIFKGTGFYITDYKKKPAEKGTAPKSTDSKPADSKPGDSKPATPAKAN